MFEGVVLSRSSGVKHYFVSVWRLKLHSSLYMFTSHKEFRRSPLLASTTDTNIKKL